MAVGISAETGLTRISVRRHVVIGAGAGISLLVLYAGTVALLQDGEHLIEQTARLWYLVFLLAIGFGVQAGLFSFIRHTLRERKASASVATSGGVSAGSMVACCAHHLADVAPFVGIAGVAGFLAEYQAFFMAVGVVSNLLGITLMLEIIQRQALCPRVAAWKVDMRRVKKTAVLLTVIVLVSGGILLAWGAR